MPNIASVLKEEIGRLARKEMKAETERWKKATAQHRTEIAALKRRLSDFERLVATLGKKVTGKAPEEDGGLKKPLRFRSKGLQTLRKKLGLSAADLGQLVGVSAQTVYHWEAGKTRPKAQQLTAIADLRTTGKRKVKAQLASLNEAAQPAGAETV